MTYFNPAPDRPDRCYGCLTGDHQYHVAVYRPQWPKADQLVCLCTLCTNQEDEF